MKPGPRRTAALRRAFLAWYRARRRDLPWRRTRDPYAIWLSETMLQQTRVETAIPYYERFLERFPDVAALARADLDDVLGEWAGLGYYSRARNLHRAAQMVADRHAGALPDTGDALRELPGVGRYTAGAVASIAFDREEPLVDGNVARVFARLFGIREDVASASVVKRLWREAEALVRGPDPGDLNQALMELGATLCTPRKPVCAECPVLKHCDAHARGDAEALPVKTAKPAPKPMQAVAALVLRGGRALAVRRPPGGLLGGLWDLPGAELERGERPAPGLRRALGEELGLEIEAARKLGRVEHVFSHRRLELHVYRAEAGPGRVRRRRFDAHRWLAPPALGELPHSTLTKKALALIGSRGTGSHGTRSRGAAP